MDLYFDTFDGQAVTTQDYVWAMAALVMGIALHPYIVGQPYRLRHLRRALARVAAARDAGGVWMATPGAIFRHAMQAAA